MYEKAYKGTVCDYLSCFSCGGKKENNQKNKLIKKNASDFKNKTEPLIMLKMWT